MPPASDRTPLLSPDGDTVGTDPRVDDTRADLRRVADSFPRSVWLIATVEFCERFSFFGIVGLMQNFLQNKPDDALHTGGIGLEQASASLINQGFMLWCYLTPVFGAVAADQYIGRLKTVIASSAIYSCGLVSLCLSSVLLAYNVGFSRVALMSALVFLGVGTGGIKANVSALVAEQYTGTEEFTRVLASGEEVVVDKSLTIQSIIAMLFLFINVGSFAASVCTAAEQRYGFTLAFSIPAVVFLLGFGVFLTGRRHYVSNAPGNSVLVGAWRRFWAASSHNVSHHNRRPRAEDATQSDLSDEPFLDDLKRALSACKIFLLYPFFWAACSQLATNFVSQAATMEAHGVPNDVFVFLDPTTSIIILPILDRIIFPYFQRLGKPIGYKHRTTAGFLFCGAAMLYAAFVQHWIYIAPPCFDHPRARDCLDGTIPNQVSMFVQIPQYVFVALAEIFAAVAGIEYAYTKAPMSMKSLVMAVFLLTTSAGASIAMIASSLAKDPNLVWMYLVLSAGPLVAGIVIWLGYGSVFTSGGKDPVTTL